jgi:hypothetical protein
MDKKWTYHLVSNVADSLKVKLPAALLEEVFQGLSEQVHHHNVEHLAIFGLLVTDEVEEGNKGFTAHFVDQF